MKSTLVMDVTPRSPAERRRNKKFWEELIAHFPLI
jgi:hypothetical protein